MKNIFHFANTDY